MVIAKTTKKEKTKEKVQKVKKSVQKQRKVSKKNVNSANLVNDIEIKGDKVLEKVEKIVEKNRETTEKDIIRRKNERKSDDYKDVNLDVMISRISDQSKIQKNSTAATKNFLYLVYFLIIIAIFVFIIKWLLVPQNG